MAAINGVEIDDSLRASLCLALVPGVGPRIRQALLERFGTAEVVLSAAPSELRGVAGVGPKLTRSISDARNHSDTEKTIELCQDHGISILTDSHESYPRMLQEIADPPGVLFIHGEILADDALSVAIVGTRHATNYGIRHAERLASGLAHAGYTIVSGLARGIDSAAHRGALEAGGRTIAVLGSGLLSIYPPENESLAKEIMNNGAVISEHAPLQPPKSGSFPQRNRLITGLSLGLVVVEAATRSGALISARLAMEQGREVFAVPGNIDSRGSRGCHQLIRDGAKLVESVDDVLEEFGPLVESTPRADGSTVRHPAELQLNEQEQSVLQAIDVDPTSIDDVVMKSRLPVHRVLATVSVLEVRRLVRRISGNLVARF